MKRTGEDRILTVPNALSVFRILLIPVFAILLLNQQNILAFLIFILASITDGIDGFIARHFNQTTKIGKILDPIADRGLIICGAIILCVLNRLPLWILILVLIKGALFLVFGYRLLKKYNIRVNVILLGKIATTFLYIGFASLILAWPIGYGFGVIDVIWLPGFSSDLCFYGIYFVYIGIFLNIFTCFHYIKEAYTKYKKYKDEQLFK